LENGSFIEKGSNLARIKGRLLGGGKEEENICFITK
jgi:hypothetical protein